METQLVLDLFSGIGGFTLGGMISGGFQTVAFCEINNYCQQVLALRFPGIPIFSDIKHVSANSIRSLKIQRIDGITAGLPCPAFSVAGKQLGSQDERNLFPEFFRIIREVRPQWTIVENVPGLLSTERGEFFIAVLREFASCGYDVEWSIVSAASVGAVHKRERLWIIAHTNLPGCNEGQRTQVPTPRCPTSHPNCWQQQSNGRDFSAQTGTNPASLLCRDDCDSGSNRCQQQLEATDQRGQVLELGNRNKSESLSEPHVCLSDDGFLSGMDGPLLRHDRLEEWLIAATIPKFSRLSAEEVRSLTPEEQAEYRELWKEYQVIRRQHKEQLKALGNAIVPECAAIAFDKLKSILNLV